MRGPFRFLVGLTVINLVEPERMNTKDFIRTESYSLRLKPSELRRLLRSSITG
ncbi:hypothetical protein [Methanomethylovorans sp.]|uniref:hypothetical protein n=1 Tax=Methanomethylovorans sp. TaxID=2758717 RepID=UPI00351C3E16